VSTTTTAGSDSATAGTQAVEPGRPPRLASADAYRGMVMLLLMGEALHFNRLAGARPGSAFWAFLARHQTHAPWLGCSLHDLIQPSFSLLVGVALPYSVASRRARGQGRGALAAHACLRGLVLVALGIALRSLHTPRTNYTFEDTLTQIGLGYPLLFLLAFRPPRDQWLSLVAILVGYWAAFALYTPPPGFDAATMGVPADWPHHLRGFAAHWDKNANLASAFDRRFLNFFPRAAPFTHNGGGYATLSFIPTLGTMILGLLAGGILRRTDRTWQSKATWLVVAGVIGLGAGWGLDASGVCPVVKRIWTPSWVLFSGGWCFLILAAWYVALDGLGLRRWAFPLRVVGMNSIAAYVLTEALAGFASTFLTTHLGRDAFRALGPDYEPLLEGVGVLLLLWLVLYWMDRQRIYVRV